jgi:hypothetical protein
MDYEAGWSAGIIWLDIWQKGEAIRIFVIGSWRKEAKLYEEENCL